MARQLFGIVVVTGALLLAASPVFAHHSIAAEFDTENPITLDGTIKEVVWMSPHISVFVDVPQDNGEVLTYEAQGGPPNRLYRGGARPTDLMPGSPASAPEPLLLPGRGMFSIFSEIVTSQACGIGVPTQVFKLILNGFIVIFPESATSSFCQDIRRNSYSQTPG